MFSLCEGIWECGRYQGYLTCLSLSSLEGYPGHIHTAGGRLIADKVGGGGDGEQKMPYPEGGGVIGEVKWRKEGVGGRDPLAII